MPIYEYQCKTCDHEFERLVFTHDNSKVECPECKSFDVNKKMSATRFMSGSSIGKCADEPARGFG